MNPYLEFVKKIEANIEAARGLSVSGQLKPGGSGETVLLFSPHPDDECVTGLLPLRLMRETGRQVVNVPVTFGSNPERQAERAKELEAACGYLGWSIHHETKSLDPLRVEDIVRILLQHRPDCIFMPHEADWNVRHLETRAWVMQALEQMDTEFSCLVVETEFWGAMDDPNLMVEGDAVTVADLVAATSLHTGEVARNPYHLLLPAWMQDNVRRGAERVGGAGGAAPDFSFATLYRLSKWESGELQPAFAARRAIGMDDDLNGVFSWK